MADLEEPQIVRVVDFETTGLPEEPDAAVCEVGYVDVNAYHPEKSIGGSWSSLINPGRPIPPQLSAVHHIVDADVEKMPAFDVAERALNARMTRHDVYAAHNAAFEKHFFPGGGKRWICTYKCALRAWPDAPGHSNQVLRYWLGLDVDRDAARDVHRALPDAIVTAQILRKLLFMRPIARLVELSERPAFLVHCPGSKHRGKTFKEVAEIDLPYLTWIAEKSEMSEDAKFTARWYIERSAAA